MVNNLDSLPQDQQEDEDDISGSISFKDAVVLNSDWTIETINSQIKKGNIDLDPGFQRRIAWDDVRKSRLIESIIVGMPVPNIVLAENKNHRGKFIVIDGKQRLSSIREYLEGLFKLKGLDIRKDLNGLEFNNLPSDDQEFLENATLRSTMIKNWHDENFLYAIFFRLNSGSLPLSPQELRKAMLGGNLLEAIDDYISKSPSYKKVFGDKLDKRMRDSELVLRFLAFDLNISDYNGDFRQFLDRTTEFFEENWMENKDTAKKCFDRLNSSLELSHEIFGPEAFKKWTGDRYERTINRAIFDCLSRFFADNCVIQAATGKKHDIVEEFKNVCIEQEFKDSIEKTTKSVKSTFYRIDRWGECLSSCLGLSYDKQTRRIG